MSKQPQPTRNATVPAPPLSPVVSRSMNTVRPSAGVDEQRRVEHPQAVAAVQLAVLDQHVAVEPIGFVAAIDDQALAEARW